jgi:hypothetical protein
VRARASRRRIAEASALVRLLLDDIAAEGGLKGRVHREALDVIDAYAQSGVLDREAFTTGRAAVTKVIGQIGFGSPILMRFSYVPIQLVFSMVEDGEDLMKHVLDHAASCVGRDRVDTLHALAVARSSAIDDTPITPPAHEIIIGGTAADLDLPAIAIALLGSAGRTGKHAMKGWPATPALLAFEKAYGGLEVFESDPEAPALVVGAYANVGTGNRQDDLVPVIMAWDDVYYALDSNGRGFTLASMVEGVYRPSAPNGRALLTQAILWRALSNRPFATLDGLAGASFGLPTLDEACGETERWWTDGDRLVVEIDRGNGFAKAMTLATGPADQAI